MNGFYGEVYKAEDGYRFRIKAANNEIVASGESYQHKTDAISIVELLTGEDAREVDE